MSLFTDASLVMIPSGIKDQKIYSVTPTDGSGDLTFTRSNDTASRVASNGLIEKVLTNLYTYSQSFANAAWLAVDVTKVSTSATDPNGGTTAANITWTSGSGRYFYQNEGMSSTATVSIWVKSNGGGNSFRLFANGGTSFSSNLTATSTWTRYSFAFAGTGSVGIGISNASDNSAADLLVAFAQLETGDIATDYIATTTAAVSVGPVANLPRLDYSGGASCPRLLLEPQRTNSQTYSEDLTQATAWGLGDTTISANATTSPDGYQNADKLVETATTARHELYGKSLAFSGTSSVSFFAKAAERRYLSAFVAGDPSVGGATFDLQTGTITETSGGTTAKIEDYTNGWYRCSFTTTSTATTTLYLCLRTNGGAPTIETYAGDGTSGLYIWGAQTELAGAYASSYIPTLGAAVTRGADAASKTSATALIGQTEGTAFIEFNIDNLSESGGEKVLFYMKDTGVGERYLSLVNNGNLTYVEYNGAIIANITKSSMAIGNHKAAIAYANNDFVLYVDGVLAGSDTSGTPNGYSTFGLQYYSASVIGKQSVSQALLFKTRLSNADLATLTA